MLYRFGKSDPVCVVRAHGSEVGATKCIKNTLDPIWDKAAETFEAPVAADGALAEIIIEVPIAFCDCCDLFSIHVVV
jgi:C2 domain